MGAKRDQQVTAFDPAHHPVLAQWAARAGATRVQIAKLLGISVRRLAAWEKEYSVLAEALKRGSDWADGMVEDSLLKLATGYDYDEAEIVRNAKGGDRVKKLKKHRGANAWAAIFWLKNRRPQQWQENGPAAAPDKIIRFRPMSGGQTKGAGVEVNAKDETRIPEASPKDQTRIPESNPNHE